LQTPSLRRNSLARVVADSYGLLTSFAVAAITGRVLGPAGKGFFSTLILLSNLVINVFSAGLGEAAIVQVRGRRVELGRAVGATLAAGLGLSVVGSLTMFLASNLVVHAVTQGERQAIIYGTLLVFLHVPALAMVAFLNSLERIVAGSVVFVIYSTITAVGVWVLTSLANMGVAGAVLGSTLGNLFTLVAILWLLHDTGVRLRPRWNATYLRRALPYGAALQLSNVLVLAAGRIDLLVVYRLRGPSAAGLYSVALTIGTLVGTIANALAYASFPRLAGLDRVAADDLTARVFRVGMLVVAAGSVVLAGVTPIAVPLLFGSAYQGSVAPALVLIVAGVLWSGQWLLARASAARGSPLGLCASFATSLAVMIALDLALIPPMGELGAATAALVGTIAGLGVVVSSYRRDGWRLRTLIPRRSDLKSVLAVRFDLGLGQAGRDLS